MNNSFRLSFTPQKQLFPKSPQITRHSYSQQNFFQQKRQSLESFSLDSLQDISQGTKEWRNIQDIVRVTFKELSEVIKSQQRVKDELINQLRALATNNDFSNQLQNKIDRDETSRQLDKLSSDLEQKALKSETMQLIEDKSSSQEVQQQMKLKISQEELQTLVNKKASDQDLNQEIHKLNNNLQNLTNLIQAELQKCGDDKEIQQIKLGLEYKISESEFFKQNNEKIDQQDLNSALNQKVNQSDIETMLANKVDFEEFQKAFQAIEVKADNRQFKKARLDLQKKLDKQELQKNIIPEITSKADKQEYEKLIMNITSLQTEMEQKLKQQKSENEAFISEYRTEIQSIQENIEQSLDIKMNAKDFKQINSILNHKIDIQQVKNQGTFLLNGLAESLNKLNFQQSKMKQGVIYNFQEQQEIMTNKMVEFAQELKLLNDNIEFIEESRKKSLEKTAKKIRKSFQKIKQMNVQFKDKSIKSLQQFSEEIVELQNTKTDQRESQEFHSKILFEHLKDKQNVQDFNEQINSYHGNAIQIIKDLKQEHQTNKVKVIDNLKKALEEKISQQQFDQALSQKMDILTFQKKFAENVNKEELIKLQNQNQKMLLNIGKKADLQLLEQHIFQTKAALEDVSRDMSQLVNIKDFCTLLDQKVNIDDSNQTLNQFYCQLQLKGNKEEILSQQSNQTIINEVICSESNSGRWIWKSGSIERGFVIPWEIQVVNNSPDNYIWERNSVEIIVVCGGIYEITFGFYSRKKPTVTLLVNGDPIFLAVSNASLVIHHSSGKLKQAGKHSAGIIAGLTLVDFIVLPENARVSISYKSETKSEGFLSLKKF